MVKERGRHLNLQLSSSNFHITPTKRSLSLDRFMVISKRCVLSDTGVELMTRQQRIRDLDRMLLRPWGYQKIGMGINL
ncbi:hypothetical protein TNCV_1312621 [Trichonephila clavipes]|nr:hypothetical protein TNCV_1312621 [Trichonephila clavipes]